MERPGYRGGEPWNYAAKLKIINFNFPSRFIANVAQQILLIIFTFVYTLEQISAGKMSSIAERSEMGVLIRELTWKNK